MVASPVQQKCMDSPVTSPCSLLTFFFLQRGKYVFAALYKNDFLSYFKDLASLLIKIAILLLGKTNKLAAAREEAPLEDSAGP